MIKLLAGFGVTYVVLLIALLAAELTHIIWAIMLLGRDVITTGQLVLGVLGVVFPPLGIIHGVMIWFGAA